MLVESVEFYLLMKKFFLFEALKTGLIFRLRRDFLRRALMPPRYFPKKLMPTACSNIWNSEVALLSWLLCLLLRDSVLAEIILVFKESFDSEWSIKALALC